MKGSKKAPPSHQEKTCTKSATTAAPSSSKPSPIFKGRQSVKVKYGIDDDTTIPTTSSSPSPAPGAQQSNKKPGPNAPSRSSKPSNTQATATTNARPKPKVIPPSQGPSTRPSGPSPKSSSNTQTPPTTNFTQPRPQPPQLPKKGECEICRQPCRSHCAGCKRVFYCSKQHQQQDWSKHKLICRPFSIPTQYSSGFHLRPPGSSSLGSSSTSFNTSSSNNNLTSSSHNLSPELQFMISTKTIAAGSVLFSEKPLLVTANVFGPISNQDPSTIWCSSCLKCLSNPDSNVDKNNNNSSSTSCPICQVPLCSDCLQYLGNMDSAAGLSKKFHGGQGHSSEECALISELCQKIPEMTNFIESVSSNIKFAQDLMKDLTVLRALMFRTTCPWRWESLIALRNNPRYISCCKHNFGNLESWLASSASSLEYPVSSYYWKNICKEKNILLADIIKIVAVFCEVSSRNPGLLVLYENLAWLAHTCTPNAEQFFRNTQEDSNSQFNNLEIFVKAVNVIDEGSKITLNYLTNYEGGRSALALRLFQSKGQYCCDTDCVCYQPRCFDKTMGIRCDLIFSSKVCCTGILSPRLDAPNPERANLGLGMFMKSKKWECDKCKKSEKYESLHTKIMEIAQDLSGACDKCCNSSSTAGGGFSKGQQQPFLQLQNKLLSHLSDQHWMVWKAKLRILKSWTTSIGYGPQMLRSSVSQSSCVPPSNLIYILKQKVDMYGDGIYGNDLKNIKTKMGVLALFAKRHGRFSPKRGHILFDAFYANLIVLLEDYKKELPLPSGKSDLKRGQVAREYYKKLLILQSLLGQTVECLKITDGTTLTNSTQKSLKMAKESLECLQKVITKLEQRPSLIISYLIDLLELYSCQDSKFILSSVRNSRPKSDPFRQGFTEDDHLDFEVESVNLGQVSFTFGAATIGQSSEGVNRSSASTGENPFNFGATGFHSSFGFSGFDSPMFGNSDIDSCSGSDIDDDEDNPFIYSRTSKNSKSSSNSGYYTGKTRASGTKGGGGGSGKGVGPGNKKTKNGNDDWSNYFWFSSDDDSSPLDDEFDLGFTSSTGAGSSFGGDLFNDQELEDLAEWAAVQFMMGKMKL